MPTNLEAKVTISAVDRVSAVVKNVSKSLDGLKASTQSLSTSWNKMTTAGSEFVAQLRNISLVIVAAGAGVLGFTNHYANLAQELQHASQKAGITAESLQKLQYAAKLSDVPIDDLNNSLKFLNRSIAVASSNPISEQAAAFASMGIAVRDCTGKLKSADVVLAEMSDRFKKYPDGAAKVATAMTTMGRAGTTLIPLLNQGSEAIKRQQAEFTNLGHVMTEADLLIADKFDNDFKRLTTAIEGVAMTIALDLMPVIDPILNYMKDWIVANKEWLKVQIVAGVEKFAKAIKIAFEWLEILYNAANKVISIFGGLQNIIIFLAGVYVAKLIVSFGQLVLSIVSLSKTLSSLFLMMISNPIALVVAGVVALSYAVYELINHWQEFKTFMAGIWGAAIANVEKFMNLITFGMYGSIKEMVGIVGNGVLMVANSIYETFEPLFTWLMAGINSVLSVFGLSTDKMKQQFSNLFNAVVDFAKTALNFMIKPFQKLEDWVTSIYGKVVALKEKIFGGDDDNKIVDYTTESGRKLMNERLSNVVPFKNTVLDVNAPSAKVSGSDINSTPSLSAPSLMSAVTQTQTQQRLDIHMMIDYEGRPTKVVAKSASPITFEADVGRMI